MSLLDDDGAGSQEKEHAFLSTAIDDESALSLLNAEGEPLKEAAAINMESDAGTSPHKINTRRTPLVAPSNVISLAEKVYVFLRGIVQGVLGPVLPRDTPNRLKLPNLWVPGLHRTCSFGEKVSLEKVKEIKNKFKGTTVNDVLSAVLNMAIRRYYEAECASFLHSRPLVRALFPINMRTKGADARGSLGNCFSTGMFQFVFDYKSRTDLVWQVKRQVDLIKISPQVSQRLLPPHSIMHSFNNGA